MNFELTNLFKFQALITEMQFISVQITDPQIRDKAIKRIDDLIDIYQTFEKYYYSAHFNEQRVLALQFELQEMRNKMLELSDDNTKLLKSLQWDTQTNAG